MAKLDNTKFFVLRDRLVKKSSITLGNNTIARNNWYHNNAIDITLHNNLIATIHEDKITLYNGGWESYITKQRLNVILRDNDYPYRVYQKNYTWYLYQYSLRQSYDFVSGYTIHESFFKPYPKSSVKMDRLGCLTVKWEYCSYELFVQFDVESMLSHLPILEREYVESGYRIDTYYIPDDYIPDDYFDHPEYYQDIK